MEIFCTRCGQTIHTEKKCPKCGSSEYEAIPSWLKYQTKRTSIGNIKLDSTQTTSTATSQTQFVPAVVHHLLKETSQTNAHNAD